MKFTKHLSYLFCALISSLVIEAQVVDDFNDGDFSSNPEWIGDISEFEVDSEFKLHLLAPALTEESHLVTASAAIENAQWDITLSMDFNPSSGNRAYVYLVSDAADLQGDLNGYFVMVGNTADEVSLYRQDGDATTKIIDGIDDLTDLEPVDISIRVTRDALGNWELLRDLNNSGTYSSEGTVMDDTHGSSAYFGVLCDYTSTRSELFYFDNVTVTGTGVVDVIPPNISSVTVVDDITLDVTFSEAVEAVSAENLANYTWLPFNNASAATLAGQVVTLTFGSAFPENVAQSLQVEFVTDLAGNSIGSVTEPFTYFVVSVAGPGDVIINELMADPSPVVGLPEAEYVELYNTSNQAFDLAGWNLLNSTTDEILESYVLPAGGHLIICAIDDQAAFSSFGEVLPVASLTALSNSGDDLYLLNADGTQLDAVTYDISWYGDSEFSDGGYSLERKNPFLPCSSAANWSASIDPDGGTPGTINSIFIADDTTAPVIESVNILNLNTIQIQFSEGMDDLSVITGQYFLTGYTVIAQSPTDPSLVTLDLSPALELGSTYSITVSGPSDCSGNLLEVETIEFFVPDTPEPLDVIFTEIMADPSPPLGLPDAEYLELLNTSDKVLNLRDWGLVNSGSTTLLNNFILQPGAYVILCDAEDALLMTQYGDVLGIESFSTLGNTADELGLTDIDGVLIDAVSYTSNWYNDEDKDDGGYSLELINPEIPCSSSLNWTASNANAGGTPGAQNSVYDLSPDLTAPAPLYAVPLSAQVISIAFSEPLEAGSVLASNLTLTPAIELLGASLSADRQTLLIILDDVLEPLVIYTITMSGLEDCSGNMVITGSTVLTALPVAAEEGDLVINEILYNPRSGGFDFVEIYNRSPRAISLKDWKMATRENGQLDNPQSISSEDLLLLPGEFKVLSEKSSNILINYPQSVAVNLHEIADLPSYPDDEGYVLLLAPNADIHDEFYYNRDYQLALIDILDGVSLERVDYDRLTNDPTNWHSAAASVGYATPGYANSQLTQANVFDDSFSIEPDVFTPDNDGDQDLLLINYMLDNPGSVANITIYDRDGRLVRRLTRNELLSTKGTITWDGITDQGSKARIGVYILLIELFDTDGGTSSMKKTCVLGGRL